jgi:hypothetical protein
MPVLIQINGENAGEAIKELSALAAGIAGRSVTAESTESESVTAAPKTEKPSKTRTKPDPTTAPPAAPPEPEDEPVNDEPKTDDSDASDEPIPTDVELRELARKIGSQGPEGKAAIKELLNQYGVPNITAMPNEKRIAFKRELEALA